MSEENNGNSFDVLLATIWRGKWIIALAVVLSVLAGLYYAFAVATPLFRSTAVVILETQQDSIVDLQNVVGGLTGDSSEVNSEVEVLRSRGLMGKVVDQLDLVKDPEFNAGLRSETVLGMVKRKSMASIGAIRQKAALSPQEEAKRTRDRVISVLLEKVAVRNVPLSLVFRITTETESPEKSALIADTIVNRYILNQLEVKLEAAHQASNWLAGRVAELRGQLELATSAVSRFSASTELVSPEALQTQEIHVKELRERIGKTRDGLEVARQRLETLKAAVTRNEKERLANDPQLSRLLAKGETDEQLAAFDARFALVLARAELEFDRATAQLSALVNSKNESEAEIARQGKDLIELQQLTREAESIRLLYEYFLTRLKETAAQQGIQQADSRVLSTAVVPVRAASPRKSLVLAMSGLFGLLAGLGLVLFLESRNTGFRSASELEAHTGYTVLGQIPQIPAHGRKRALQYLSDKPTSAAAEALRNLRTSVLLSNPDKPAKVILSTSSVPGEGKTTNSLALAQNLVGLGKSVLLIEGDIRRRTFSQYFAYLPDRGLVSVVTGDLTLGAAVDSASYPGVDILIGERPRINAADLFASDRFRALVEQARAEYDVVIIDTPPVLVVPDARIIAQMSDTVLFTVLWDRTSRQQVDEALRMFHNSGQTITGLVLSQINPRRMKQYGYGASHGAYGGFGESYYSN